VNSEGAAEPHASSAAQHRAAGRSARKALPRADAGSWTPSPDRPDPVEVLRAQEATRVPELLPVRHERMIASPFAFFRGADAIMASDLATGGRSGLLVQCCGDAHLANFGGFAAPDRALVFDINDFDETHPGPFEWDVMRLAASLEIAARARSANRKASRAIVEHAVCTYRTAMRRFASMSDLDVWYTRLDVSAVLKRWRRDLPATEIARLDRWIAKGGAKDSLKAFAKLTRRVNGEVRIVSDPPLVVPLDELLPGVQADRLRDRLNAQIGAYLRSIPTDRRRLLQRFRLVDFARKVVGVGSVGMQAWIALLVGADDGSPLFLQIKEADSSVLERYTRKSEFANHGRRVVEGQRLLQAASDILLGWSRTSADDGGGDYYVRQLWDRKMSPHVDVMSDQILKVYGEMCGWALARGHARSGDRIAIAAYLGSSGVFDRALASFASVYADQNQSDYEKMRAAVRAAKLGPSQQIGAKP
jgi:uncharacterized protein (DUF2252 family)